MHLNSSKKSNCIIKNPRLFNRASQCRAGLVRALLNANDNQRSQTKNSITLSELINIIIGDCAKAIRYFMADGTIK